MFLLFFNKKKYLSFIFLFNFIFSNQSNLDQLSIVSAQYNSNSEIDVYINLTNDVDVAGFQFVLYDIPDILSYVAVSSTERTNDFIVSAAEGEAGTTIIGFSLTGSTITSGDGNIIKVTYNVQSIEFDTIINLGINGSVLSDQNANSINHNANSGIITIINEQLTIPGTPQNLRATSNQNSISLYWDTVWQAQNYQIWEVVDNDKINVYDIDTNYYTIIDLNSLKEYCFSVTASNNLGQSDYSDILCISTQTEITPNIYFEDPKYLDDQFFVSLNLQNYSSNPISGIQFKISDNPNYLVLNNFQLLTFDNRLEGFEINFNEQSDGSVLFIIFSLSGQAITPGDGPILFLEYNINDSSDSIIFLELIETIISDQDGIYIDHTASSIESKQIVLSQNYPNPFNSHTTIKYNAISDGFVKLNVYDVKGNLIKTLTNNHILRNDLGINSILWDGKDSKGSEVSSGVYIYSLQTSKNTLNKKMTFIK